VKTQSSHTDTPAGWRRATKLQAFLSHLALSTGIVAIVLGIVFFVWYPAPFAAVVGTWSIVRILIGVDLVLGPLLTLIVFRPGKPGLLFDMSVIGLVQAAALIYGALILYQERPYFVVFAVDRFHVLARKDALVVDETIPAWIRKPLIGPAFAIARLPRDAAALQQLTEETVFGGAPDIEKRPQLWAPYAAGVDDVARAIRPLETLRRRDSRSASSVDAALDRNHTDSDAIGFVPIVAREHSAVALVRRSDGVIIGIVEADPWRN
jgi:hypothetical protein